jgi:serine/threonine protein phosphatase PrpC
MVVADGMGGHLREVASQIAVQLLTEAFQREAKPMLRSAAFQHSRRALRVGDYAKARNLIESPRTTCVACIVHRWRTGRTRVPRLYHVRDGRIQAQTRDHSRVQMLVTRARQGGGRCRHRTATRFNRVSLGPSPVGCQARRCWDDTLPCARRAVGR